MRNYACTCKGICCYNLVYSFLIYLSPWESSVFVVHFSNAFRDGNETFPKGSSENEVVSLLVIFHLPYSYTGVWIYVFTFVVLKIKIFHSFRTRVVRIALLLYSCYLCRTRVALVSYSYCFCIARVSLGSHSCRSYLALVL